MKFSEAENLRILARLNHYSHLAPLQVDESYDQKVMVTGFGLFKGVSSNITASLTRALADEMIYLKSQNSKEVLRLGDFEETPSGRVFSPVGIDRALRVVELNGQRILLNLVNLDVQWDYAAAVICHELETFAPDSLLMMGQGKEAIILEAGALNQTCALSGFLSSGEPLLSNAAPSLELCAGHQSHLAMKWPREKIAAQIQEFADRLGSRVEVPDSYRSNNVYICNQVSYLALLAGEGASLNIAGKTWTPKTPRPLKNLGFLHLPIREKISRGELADWLSILSIVVSEMTS